MPTISIFYGIVIRMYYFDHNPPHFHAQYGSARALVRLSDGEVLAGHLPTTAERLVRQWAVDRHNALLLNWQRASAGEPLERIPGPDGDGNE
ncbi:DUF4160 domain-containing protein [Jiella endophytica]|uniref:DUF4160 domain-containing protein n=1 Tax=Jiella endophytica TaxID=2558362 RepID=A0A4Y8RDM9_9HYPH|nr:DUF4160 domain-containing protein [Jiella endophytica]TFF20402.1 DUF4160 domain-containing protein [Jiella endophytica]